MERWAGHLIRRGEVGGATNEKVGGAYQDHQGVKKLMGQQKWLAWEVY